MEELFLLAALGFAAFTDIRSRTIPVPTFPVCCIAAGLFRFFCGTVSITESFYGIAVLSVPFLFMAFFGFCGGADLLMMACIGFVVGIRGCLRYALYFVLSCLVVFAVCFTVKAIKRLKTGIRVSHGIPMAPIALIAYVLYLIF